MTPAIGAFVTRPGIAAAGPKALNSDERESQQARTQQHKAGRCQGQEAIGNQIVIAHDETAV